jgi:uncharacterized repeat protein (TIGR02543 family)
MRKALLKDLLCAVFCAVGVLYMGSCVDPVDLSAFTNDKDVQDNYEKGASVDLTIDSEPGLEKGYRKITGLNLDKYYGVIEWEVTDGVTHLLKEGVQFVDKNGVLSTNVGNIGSVTGGAITELSNDHHYKVITALPLNVSVDYNDYYTPVSGTETPTEGIIELPRPTDNHIVYYLKPNLPNLAEYDVAEVFSNGSSGVAATTPDGRIMTTISAETVVHYVFFRADPILSTLLAPVYEFFVLKIGASSPPPEGSITINFYKNDGTLPDPVYAQRHVMPGWSINAENQTMPTVSRPGYTFEGWYTEPGTGGTKFDEDTIVGGFWTNPTNVYARWELGGGGENGNLNISVSFTLNAAQKTFTLSQNPVNLSQATLLGPGPKIVTVTLNDTSNVFIPATIKWTFTGATMTWSTNTLSIDYSDPDNLDLLVIGTYTITIEATAIADNAPYSSSLNLVIAP